MVKQGDIIWVNFDPTEGREQRGRRPALVISNTLYNEKREMVLACPITSKIKKINLCIQLDERTNIQGSILCEQVRLIDLRARGFQIVEHVPDTVLASVCAVVKTIIDFIG